MIGKGIKFCSADWRATRGTCFAGDRHVCALLDGHDGRCVCACCGTVSPGYPASALARCVKSTLAWGGEEPVEDAKADDRSWVEDEDSSNAWILRDLRPGAPHYIVGRIDLRSDLSGRGPGWYCSAHNSQGKMRVVGWQRMTNPRYTGLALAKYCVARALDNPEPDEDDDE